jgi:hypothetical protein
MTPKCGRKNSNYSVGETKAPLFPMFSEPNISITCWEPAIQSSSDESSSKMALIFSDYLRF